MVNFFICNQLINQFISLFKNENKIAWFMILSVRYNNLIALNIAQRNTFYVILIAYCYIVKKYIAVLLYLCSSLAIEQKHLMRYRFPYLFIAVHFVSFFFLVKYQIFTMNVFIRFFWSKLEYRQKNISFFLTAIYIYIIYIYMQLAIFIISYNIYEQIWKAKNTRL